MSGQNNPQKPQSVLWYRPSRRHKWREVGRAATGPQALALMDTSGIHGGSWMLLVAGEDPNVKTAEQCQSLKT